MSFPKKNSILRIFIAIASMAIIGLAMLAGWSGWKSYQLQSELIELRIKSQASRIDRSFTDAIDTTAYLLNHLSNQVRNNATDEVYIEKILKSFRNSNVEANDVLSLSMFSWINHQSFLTVNSELGILPRPKDLTLRDYVIPTVSIPGRIQLGQPLSGSISSEWIIPVAMGLVSDNGEYLGAVNAGLHIANFIIRLEKGIENAGVHFAILDQHLNVILESSNNRFKKNASFFTRLDDISFDTLSTSPLSIIKPLPFINDERYTVIMKSKYPYIVAVSYDKKSSDMEIRKALTTYFIEFTIIAIIFLILFYAIKKHIISPIIALSSVADQISKGRNEITIPASNSYEISNLSMQLKNVIDYMEKLRATQKSLESSVKELEEEKDKAEAARATAEIAREEAHHAMMSKGQFLGKVVHEIQVPVNTVLDYADKQVKQLTANSINNEYMRYGKRIAESARFIMLLVGDLLERAKSESDTLRLDERPLHIKDIINYSMDMLQTRAAKHGVDIRMEVPDHLPQLFADDLRMKQILNNILSNAVKYTPTGGHVRITASMDSYDRIHIEVIDTGLGILPDEIDKITDDFYRINRHKQKVEGTGLGLPLAKRLMELHGGSMHISSTINIGTHVTLSFPEQRTLNNQMPFFSQAI